MFFESGASSLAGRSNYSARLGLQLPPFMSGTAFSPTMLFVLLARLGSFEPGGSTSHQMNAQRGTMAAEIELTCSEYLVRLSEACRAVHDAAFDW
jgi:hypothetical protein